MPRTLTAVICTLATTLALAGASPAAATPTQPADHLAPCQYEDGNVDGTACTWVDPDTGNRYRVDSENYGGR